MENTQENETSTDSYFNVFKVQDATRKLFVNSRVHSKTRTTPVSNPNSTPFMEKISRVNILQDSGMCLILTQCASNNVDVLDVT